MEDLNSSWDQLSYERKLAFLLHNAVHEHDRWAELALCVVAPLLAISPRSLCNALNTPFTVGHQKKRQAILGNELPAQTGNVRQVNGEHSKAPRRQTSPSTS